MTIDYVIMWHIKNIIAQFSLRLQSLNVVEIHMKIKHYHLYMAVDVIP